MLLLDKLQSEIIYFLFFSQVNSERRQKGQDKMKPKLLVADIDGTLIEHGQEFTEYTKDVIEHLRFQGMQFGLASGRPFEHMFGCSQKWGFSKEFDFFIGMNGAELFDTYSNEVYKFSMLKREDIKEIVDIMDQYECNGFVYEGADMYVQKIDDQATLSAIRNGILNYEVDDTFFYSKERAKLMFRFHDLCEVEKVEKHFSLHPSSRYCCFKTQANLIEFSNSKTNKIVALRKYCQLHNISLNDVIAAGDTSNDNEMLEACGLGICLLNGSDDTKACADVVTELECKEDGLAHYLDKNIVCLFDFMKGE